MYNVGYEYSRDYYLKEVWLVLFKFGTLNDVCDKLNEGYSNLIFLEI